MALPNPYQPPVSDSIVSVDAAASARQRLSRPATALVIMASIHSVFGAIPLVSFFVMLARGLQGGEDPIRAFVGGLQFIVLLVICIGAARMGHLKSYRLAWVAAILSCVPGVSPFFFLGIPFGIWSIVLLRDAKIRSAFRSLSPTSNGG